MATLLDTILLDERTTDPTSPVEGEVWYNSADKKVRGYINGATRELLSIFGTPSDGYVATWVAANSRWEPKPVSGAAQFGNDYQYEEVLGQAQTTSSSWQIRTTLTTPALAGTYRVGWMATGTTDGDEGQYRLWNDTDSAAYDQQSVKYGNADDNSRFVGGFQEVTFTGTAKTFKVQWRDRYGGHTAYIEYAKIEFWRVE